MSVWTPAHWKGNMTQRLTSKEFLVKVKETIVDRGWCKGKLRDEDDRVCMLGAFEVVSANRMRLTRAEAEAESAIRSVIAPHTSIAQFNDASTLDQVFDVLDRAIASLP